MDNSDYYNYDGAYTEWQEIRGENDEMYQKFVDWQPQIELAAGINFWVFNPISYSSQVVSGTKYQIIFAVGGKSTLTVNVYEPFEGDIQVEVLDKNFKQDSGVSLTSSLIGIIALVIAINY